MEGIRKIAEAHYANGSARVQTLAHNFFNAMDEDGDGSITLAEFTSFMEQEGYASLNSTQCFNCLDNNNNGTLDFMEVMTLYYLIKSGRPFCKICNFLVMGTYFVCVECFKSSTGPYCLCMDCYSSKKSAHNHDGRWSQFLDNYAMLENMRIVANNQNKVDTAFKALDAAINIISTATSCTIL